MIAKIVAGAALLLALPSMALATGDTFALAVIPEPGTALLMGLGLAGLATVRRR
jgi:hypothetical protein